MDDELRLADGLTILRRRFWVVLLVVFLAVGAAIVLSYRVLPHVYQSNTSLIVNERSNAGQTGGGVDYGQIQTSQALAVTYAKIITSRVVLQATIDALNLPETVKQLAKMTTVQVEDQTEIISIAVKDRDPVRAAAIANAMADSFIAQLPILVNRVENVSVIDPAVPVYDKVSPRPLLNVAVAFVASSILGILLAFLVDHLDDTIKTSEDIKKLFGLRVLAMVPEVKIRRTGHDSTQ